MVATPHPKLILLLMTDQFRQDAFQPDITPNLYTLSQSLNATAFANAYVSTPTCTPSRAGLLTGKSPWAHGMLGYAYTVNCPAYPTTLPSVLTEFADYETYAVGKNHFGWDKHGHYVTHGMQHLQVYDAMTNQPHLDDYKIYFDHLHPGLNPLNMTFCGHGHHRLQHNDWEACAYGNSKEEEHPTRWTTRQALEYLNDFDFSDTNPKNMFLKVSYHRPHSPYDPPRRLLEKRLQSDHIPERILSHNATNWEMKFKNTTGAMSEEAWYGDPGDAAAKHSRAGYLASVEFVDEGIGELMDWLKKHDLFDEAMILWTTDHGDMNGDHYLWRKGYAYEGSSHVNLIAKLPTVWNSNHNNKAPKAPTTSHALVETRDIAVTIYDALGVLTKVKERDPLVDGKSLLPILQDKSGGLVKNPESFRKWLDLEHARMYRKDIHWNAIVGFQSSGFHKNISSPPELWKYIFHALDGSEQLFCLTTDCTETNDLSGSGKWQHMLEYWRSMMVHQFQKEERGKNWVQGEKLVAGRESVTLGPHFPCNNMDVLDAAGDILATVH